MEWSKYSVYVLVVGFAIGILAGSLTTAGFYFGVFVISLGLFIILYRFLFASAKSVRVLFLISFFLVSIGLGVVRFSIADRAGPIAELNNLVGQNAVLEGVVIREPVRKERSQQIVVEIYTTKGNEARVSVAAESYPEIIYGDRVELSGALKIPEEFETETGRLFDYPAYLSKDNIFYQMAFPDIRLVSHGEGNVVVRTLLALKSRFLDSVSRAIPQPHAALIGGLVVGAQESLGEDLLRDFRVVGIIHIIVLSGYNVTIVAEAIMRFFGFLSRKTRLFIGGITITLFAILVGGTATVVRASIMALIVVVARATGRTYDISRALLMAAFIMLLVSPKILAFDPSFQLSFLATLGLIYLAPIVEKGLGFISTKWQIREFATATIATQIFVLPLLLFLMGELSLVAIFVNVLVLAVVPITMFFGFLTGIVGIFASTLSLPFAYVSFVFLEYILRVVDFFAQLSFASISVNAFPVWLAIAVYALYAIVLWVFHTKTVSGERLPRRLPG